jgi:hypothetical protein
MRVFFYHTAQLRRQEAGIGETGRTDDQKSKGLKDCRVHYYSCAAKGGVSPRSRLTKFLIHNLITSARTGE